MDPLPPNDPNRNNSRAAAKEIPHDGRRGQRNRQTQNGDTMDVVGDLRDSPVVVMMFLVGVASWFLRERCVCWIPELFADRCFYMGASMSTLFRKIETRESIRFWMVGTSKEYPSAVGSKSLLEHNWLLFNHWPRPYLFRTQLFSFYIVLLYHYWIPNWWSQHQSQAIILRTLWLFALQVAGDGHCRPYLSASIQWAERFKDGWWTYCVSPLFVIGIAYCKLERIFKKFMVLLSYCTSTSTKTLCKHWIVWVALTHRSREKSKKMIEIGSNCERARS